MNLNHHIADVIEGKWIFIPMLQFHINPGSSVVTHIKERVAQGGFGNPHIYRCLDNLRYGSLCCWTFKRPVLGNHMTFGHLDIFNNGGAASRCALTKTTPVIDYI